jgi:hypothetical protein
MMVTLRPGGYGFQNVQEDRHPAGGQLHRGAAQSGAGFIFDQRETHRGRRRFAAVAVNDRRNRRTSRSRQKA